MEIHHQPQQPFSETQVTNEYEYGILEILETINNQIPKTLKIMIYSKMLISGACDVARNYLSDILEFLSDVHTLSKVKSNVKGTVGLNEDTLGGTLKASLAQYLALEISKGNNTESV